MPPTQQTALAAAVLVGCSTGGTEKTKPENPRAVLAQAKTILDSATSVQVVITSVGVPPGVSGLVGGEGVAARPASFEGALEVSVGGGVLTVGVVSVDGTVCVKTPFAPDYVPTDPAQFGLTDPGRLPVPTGGLPRSGGAGARYLQGHQTLRG